jgi:tRNA(Leu) C34 or U34 (ribose-2'-O)-methylase TrmL
MEPRIIGKNQNPVGIAPAIILSNPKYAHNVAHTIRAASCFGISQVWYTGSRVAMDLEEKKRLPREERMKGYKDVELINYDYPFEQFPEAIPVAIELRPHAENLLEFEHPENAVYVFGPEDGDLGYVEKSHSHRFVYIPTYFCTNLSAAVYIVLYDRKMKRYLNGQEDPMHISQVIKEERIWSDMRLTGIGDTA